MDVDSINHAFANHSTYTPVINGQGDDITGAIFSWEELIDLVRTTKITTAVSPDSLSSAILKLGAVAMTDAFTSLINSS